MICPKCRTRVYVESFKLPIYTAPSSCVPPPDEPPPNGSPPYWQRAFCENDHALVFRNGNELLER